jgi:hypothetical protein
MHYVITDIGVTRAGRLGLGYNRRIARASAGAKQGKQRQGDYYSCFGHDTFPPVPGTINHLLTGPR